MSSRLFSYAGIPLTIRDSGSRVRDCSQISKVGNRKLRNLLFHVVLTLVIGHEGNSYLALT
ncbi:transposase [Zobellia roscoffensis]|uniref:transposase n=1 Tax=Zobellia roscoffensis TaxID=2779508 RepID=UPI00293BD101|nr:transposase [Zobellia roscoffensis]